MSSVFESYANVVKNEYSFYPVFPPDYPISLGDFGSLENGRFTRKGNMKKYDFIAKELKGIKSNNKIDFSEGVDFNVSLAPSVTVPGMFEANLKIAFGDSSNVFFSFNNCRTTLTDNYLELKDKIIELYNKDEWDKDYYVITEFIEAERSTVILADNSEAKIDFGVAIPIGANIPIPQLKSDFLDGKLSVNESSSSKISTKIIANTGLKPLIKLSKLKVNFWTNEPDLDTSGDKGISDTFDRNFQLSVDSAKLETLKENRLTFEEVDVKEI